MSYRINIYFSQAENIEDARRKASETMENMMKRKRGLYEVIEDNKYRIRKSRIPIQDMILNLFRREFIFWPELHLVGMIHMDDSSIKPAVHFLHAVYFQNSTDQDYELSEWKNICPAFDEKIRKSRSATAADLISKKRWKGYTAEELNDDLDYYVRSDLYDEIYGLLHLDDFLYRHERDAFETFFVQPVIDDETMKLLMKKASQ